MWPAASLAPLIAAVVGGGLLQAAVQVPAQQAPRVFSLAGEWRFLLDPDDRGILDRVWETGLPDRIRLPGSTDTGRFGRRAPEGAGLRGARRLFSHVGPAWYQRDITVPYAWRRRRITLFLERCHWESRVWLDGHAVGTQDSLSAPHVYDLTPNATPGRHRLTIRVDNRPKFPLGDRVNAVREDTQTNWNGIVGRIELRGTARVWIEELRIYARAADRVARIRARIGNVVGKAVRVALIHQATERRRSPAPRVARTTAVAMPGYTWVECALPLGDRARLWDDLDPATYGLHTELSATDGTTTWVHSEDSAFGLRDLSAGGHELRLNGRPMYLRGAIERGVFPLTGYPPMRAPEWERIFATARSYGLNHLRFDTWCPPGAAFEAADAAGFLLQVEAPFGAADAGRSPERDEWVRQEVARILDAYGNHPSFALFCAGSGLAGDTSFGETLIRSSRARDPRRLYAASSGGSALPCDDFVVLRNPPGREVPWIAHEFGPSGGYPELSDIGKLVGVLHPAGLVALQRRLNSSGLLPQAPLFSRSAGRTLAQRMLDAIGSLLVRPECSGFQLAGFREGLDPITEGAGLVDSLWDDKGPGLAEEFRRGCASTVLLLRTGSRTLSTTDTLSAGVDMVHIGASLSSPVRVDWSVAERGGRVLARGVWTLDGLRPGVRSHVGSLDVALTSVAAPAELVVSAALAEMAVRAEWPVWVYPAGDEGAFAEGVYVAAGLTATALARLRSGGRVVVLAGTASVRRSIRTAPLPGGPVGILCDPRHRALAGFPTDYWADERWTPLLERSRAAVLSEGSKAAVPIVSAVDAPSTSRPLALVLEARVGPGRLLVTTLDLLADMGRRADARQMLKSLLDYAASAAFAPEREMTETQLFDLLRVEGADPSLAESPPDDAGALLKVLAGAAAKVGSTEAWTPEKDVIAIRRGGVDYQVSGQVTREDDRGAWSGTGPLTITVSVPRGFSGGLYLHLRDWDAQRRVSQISFESRWFETVAGYGERGVWVRIPVTRADTDDGEISVALEPEARGDLVTDLVLTAGPGR